MRLTKNGQRDTVREASRERPLPSRQARCPLRRLESPADSAQKGSPIGGDETLVELLQRWNRGDRLAEEQVLGLAYPELHRIARMLFRRERRNHTLEPQALVNESYIQLTEHYDISWRSRTHFFGVMAGLMRRVLVDYHRQRNALRRGDPKMRVSLDEAHDVPCSGPSSLLALEDALTRLSNIDPQKADLVELRFFGGLTIDETASFLGISTATVERQWRRARAWLYDQLERGC